MKKLFTIAKNTFKETIRQPIYACLVIASLLMLYLTPSLTMYTMEEDSKLLREIGLSTLLITGLFIAIFAASGSVAEEIENKTIITVLSKPVERPIFIFAKFLGIAAAIVVAHFICTVALLMAIRHGVLESVNDTHDWTVMTATFASAAVALVLGAFFNYAYDWKFSAVVVMLLAVCAAVSITFLTFIDRDWMVNPQNNGINALDVYGAVLLLFGILVIAAIAVAISTRFNIAVTLSCCVGVFMLGLVSDYAFRQQANNHLWAKAVYFLVPNLQIFWISDAIYEGSNITLNYIAVTGLYSLCYISAILLLAVAVFQRRQIG